jgi:hypothetical protein
MVSQQYPLALFATTLSIALTAQPGVAVTIKLTNPNYYVPYTVGDAEGAAWIIPPTVIKPGGTNELKSLLANFSRRYPGKWIFETGQELEGSFNIKDYYACGPQTNCGLSSQKGGVGSNIYLQFEPQGNDPKINTANPAKLKWIQRVKSNHSLTTDIHNHIENILDINQGQTDPYYSGYQGSISAYKYFGDSPYRNDPLNNHTWNAELYLVEEVFIPRSTNKRVIIHNGIRWGWRNQIFRRKQPVPVPAPVPKPAPTPTPVPEQFCPPPGLLTKSGSTIVANSSSGGGGIGCVASSPSPSPTPRPTQSPTPRPTPRPTPSPTPRPTPSPTRSPIVIVSVSPAPSPSPWTPSPMPSPSPWTPSPMPSPTPWVTSPLGSTSSTVVVSTSTTITSPAPSPRPAPAPSRGQAPEPSPGGRPIRAVPSSGIPNANAQSLRSSSLFESSSKANTDYLTAISSELLEDPELSSTDNSLNNANLAGVSRGLLENPELSSTDSNENQLNLASISSDLLADPEQSSTDRNENQVDLANISSDLLEDPELSSTDSNENQVDLANISSDLLEDPELSSTDSNENELDLAGISGDLLEDPELASEDNNSLASKTKNPDDDALPAEAVPEPTTGLGTLFALAVLPVITRLKNRKNKE